MVNHNIARLADDEADLIGEGLLALIRIDERLARTKQTESTFRRERYRLERACRRFTAAALHRDEVQGAKEGTMTEADGRGSREEETMAAAQVNPLQPAITALEELKAAVLDRVGKEGGNLNSRMRVNFNTVGLALRINTMIEHEKAATGQIEQPVTACAMTGCVALAVNEQQQYCDVHQPRGRSSATRPALRPALPRRLRQLRLPFE
jgi:hypothetical protein